MNQKQILRKSFFFLSILVFSVLSVTAQTTTADLSGIVSDEQGSVVSNVTIRAINIATNLERQVVTNNEGSFTIPLLPPGNYTLRAERNGFAPVEINDILLNVNDRRAIRIGLRVAQVGGNVTVTADSGLQTQSSEVSALVNERRIRELPLNGKDFNKLVFLAPGVAQTNSSTNSPSVNGARSTANNYAIDGIQTNDERVDGLQPGGGFNSLGNAIPNIIPTEALQEFRVITSNADATFGRGSGGQINVITKSGSNRFSGSLYEYFRNDKLDARDYFNYGPFFNDDRSAKTPPFRQNLYGGTFSGPLAKDKHFFFGSFEGFRQRREQTTNVTFPNADLIRLIPGDLGKVYRTVYLDSGIIPSTGNIGSFSALPSAVRTAATTAGFNPTLFDGNTANGEAGTLLISSTLQSDYKQDAFLIRTDHKFSDKLTANFRYAFSDSEAIGGVLSDRITEPRLFSSPTAQFTYFHSPQQIFEFRAALQQSKNRTSGVEDLNDNLSSIGVNTAQGIFISASGVSGIRFIRIRPAAFSLNNATIPQFSFLHTYTRGNLTLRTGVELRNLRLELETAGFVLPVYEFEGFVGTTGLLGANPSQTQAIAAFASQTAYGVNGGPSSPRRNYRSNQSEFFTQADWQISPEITLNLGLRYLYFSPYKEADGAFSNLYAVDSGGRAIKDAAPTFLGGNTSYGVFPVSDDLPLYQSDFNNFEPRLGVAWNINGKGKSVIRAGYGLFHDRIAPLEFGGITENAPFATTTEVEAFTFSLNTPIPVNPPTAPSTVYAISPIIKNPQTHRFNISFEQQILKNSSVNVSYVGARGRNLLRYNIPNGGSGVSLALRPDPRFATIRYVDNGSSSDYDALQIFGRHRFSYGLDLTVAYTRSRSLDDVSAAFDFSGDGPSINNLGANPNQSGVQGGGSQFVPRSVRADRGLSNFDVKNSLVISHLIDLPFGKGRKFLSNLNSFANALLGNWSLTGIAVMRSGNPFTVTLGRDANDDGLSSDRPALLNGSLDSLYNNSLTVGTGRTQFLVPLAQAQTILGTSPNVTDPFSSISRNSLRAPLVRFYDVSLIKQIDFSERFKLQLELNAFNVFNNVNFNAPVSSLTDSRFGVITSTLGSTNPRQLQLGIKLKF